MSVSENPASVNGQLWQLSLGKRTADVKVPQLQVCHSLVRGLYFDGWCPGRLSCDKCPITSNLDAVCVCVLRSWRGDLTQGYEERRLTKYSVKPQTVPLLAQTVWPPGLSVLCRSQDSSLSPAFGLYARSAWMNEKIYIARLKAYKCMLNLPRLTEN